MTEKYDVEDLTRRAGGGEYPTQDGFGWSNGVALALAAGAGHPVSCATSQSRGPGHVRLAGAVAPSWRVKH